jgi:hypothetical protein
MDRCSALVHDKSWTIDRQAFNDEKKSAVDKFSCSLKFDKTLLSKIRIAEERIGIRVKIKRDPLFFGAIEPSYRMRHLIISEISK